MNFLRTKQVYFIFDLVKWAEKSVFHGFIFCLCLSWFYACCSQFYIPLPFNLVPITLQSVMFLCCAWVFGYKAVNAYFLYLIQGVCGAPFFSRFGSGLVHLLGPTGGYLLGFVFAMIFMAATKRLWLNYRSLLLFKYWFCCILYYTFGLSQLACFVSLDKVLELGFYPFIFMDFIIKAVIFLFLIEKFNCQRA